MHCSTGRALQHSACTAAEVQGAQTGHPSSRFCKTQVGFGADLPAAVLATQADTQGREQGSRLGSRCESLSICLSAGHAFLKQAVLSFSRPGLALNTCLIGGHWPSRLARHRLRDRNPGPGQPGQPHGRLLQTGGTLCQVVSAPCCAAAAAWLVLAALSCTGSTLPKLKRTTRLMHPKLSALNSRQDLAVHPSSDS